jgi:hypothetical protein
LAAAMEVVKIATQPHIEPDPLVAEGEARVLSQLGSGLQMFQVKPSGRLINSLGC